MTKENNPNVVRGDETVEELLEKIALSKKKHKQAIYTMINLTIGVSSPATFKVFKSKLKDLEPELYEKVKEVESSISSSNSGCFIATATMGDYNHPLVIDLRKFRDSFLLNSFFGRLFIKIYYFLSPSLARIISRSKFLRSLSLKLLIVPLHNLIKKKIN